MYDIIIIGARAAGSSTGMLLARKGYKVLVTDKASFPSDTLSSHQIQLPGVARLKRWGLLDKVIESNAPATRQVLFDAGFISFEGRYADFEGVDALYSPRRTYLDKILVDAARDAGAEVRENFIVDEVVMETRGSPDCAGIQRAVFPLPRLLKSSSAQTASTRCWRGLSTPLFMMKNLP